MDDTIAKFEKRVNFTLSIIANGLQHPRYSSDGIKRMRMRMLYTATISDSPFNSLICWLVVLSDSVTQSGSCSWPVRVQFVYMMIICLCSNACTHRAHAH